VSSEEEVTGGLAGRVAGKIKTAVGSVTGNDALEREGRLQDAHADAPGEARDEAAEARRAEAEADVEQRRAETEAERERL